MRKSGFEDFLARYPNSEKAAQARENLKRMERKQSSTAYDIAKFYDKQKHYRAAAIYYNEVIRQQPSSPEGERAKKRISELRAKFGDDKLQSPAVTAAAANKKSRKPRTSEEKRAAAFLERNRAAARSGYRYVHCRRRLHFCPTRRRRRLLRNRAPRRLLKPRPRRSEKGVSSLLLAFLVGGCAGYHLGPATPAHLRHIKTIAVPTFANTTLMPRIEVLVTGTVIKQFQQDGTFRIASEDQADAVLKGEIVAVNRSPARSVARQRSFDHGIQSQPDGPIHA